MNAVFPKETGSRPHLKNIDRWLKQLEAETHFNQFAEKELNIISK
jgi:glutathione S-transferase